MPETNVLPVEKDVKVAKTVRFDKPAPAPVPEGKSKFIHMGGAQTHSEVKDKGNTTERTNFIGIQQDPEISFKIKEIMAKHNGDVKAAESDIAAYHEELKRKDLEEQKAKTDPAQANPILSNEMRYLLAVAAVTSGQFDHLSYDRLLDVVALSKAPVRPFGEWLEVNKAIRSIPNSPGLD